MKRQIFLAACSIFLMNMQAASAKDINHAEQYGACMKLVREFPEQAFDAAISWKSLGGGEAAEHCIATSLIGMKRYKTGADRLEKLADESRRPKEFKAQILSQAAQGWFLGGDLDRARAVISTAIELDGTVTDYYIDRAQMRGEQKFYKDALMDLDKALALENNNVDALVFRGTIYRLTEQFDDAMSDIKKAVTLDPAHQEALLERGMLNRIQGQDDQARQDWLDAISIDERSATAETARLNLQKMDVKK